MDRSLATKEVPLLNRGEHYIPEAGRTMEDDVALTYDAKGTIRERTHMSARDFERIYNATMKYFTVQEKYLFKQYQSGEKKPEHFYEEAGKYLKRTFPTEMSKEWDYKVMMNRLNLAMFQYDVIQPLIDNKDTSDIKICGPYDIRVRVKGKAYKSNATFIDEQDLFRFVDGLAIRNRVDIWSHPVITFTDQHDPNYIMRFTVSSPTVCAVDYPYLHIRKVPKTKPFFDDLIKAGMLNEDVKLYLIDRAKISRGIVFAGPPGSGKSTALNAFIEHIPKTRESLVIQENDELHTKQSGFMFKHVTHGFHGEQACSLEDLAKMALVEGCNEFIIGEVKGGEMRYAMTLVNAGGYAALTVHSTNAYETLDKLADLVKYGSSYSFDEARRMLKTFDTIVYMEGYKIREILENEGYDDETKQFKYVNIYRYDPSMENKTEEEEEVKNEMSKKLLFGDSDTKDAGVVELGGDDEEDDNNITDDNDINDINEGFLEDTDGET